MVGRAVAALQPRIQRQVCKPHGHRVGRSGARKQQRRESAHGHQANTPAQSLASRCCSGKARQAGQAKRERDRFVRTSCFCGTLFAPERGSIRPGSFKQSSGQVTLPAHRPAHHDVATGQFVRPPCGHSSADGGLAFPCALPNPVKVSYGTASESPATSA